MSDPPEGESLLEEVVGLLHEARCEIRALRELLVDRNLVSDEELNQRIANVKMEEFSELKEESRQRAFENILKGRLKQ